MNTGYTEVFLFLSRLSRKSNKGVAMGFVLIAGVLMAATGAVMLLRSGSEREKVVAQQNTAKGIAKAEVGVTRIRFFLNQQQHQQLIKTEFDQWQTVADEISTSDGSSSSSSSSDSNQLQGLACDGSGDSGGSSSSSSSSSSGFSDAFNTDLFNKLVNKQWISVNASDPSAGEFRLTGYRLETPPPTTEEPNPEPTMLTLDVQARGLNQDDSSDLKTNNSIRAISVELPIIELSTEEDAEVAGGPGLWISDTKNGKGGYDQNAKLSDGKISAITWIDCEQNKDWKNNSSYVNNNKLEASPDVIGDFPIGTVKQIKDDLPDIPEKPTSGVYTLGSFIASNCYITLPRVGDNKAGGEKENGCKQIHNNSSDDQPVGNIYYYYFTGDDSIDLSNSQIRIKPPEGTKVVVFVKGGVKVQGGGKPHGEAGTCRGSSQNGSVKVESYIGDLTDATKLEMYLEPSDKEIYLAGGNVISGFVHAPKSKQLHFSGGQVRGAAWVNQTEGGMSSSCRYVVKQMDVGQTLVMGDEEAEPQSLTTLGQISSYRSTQVKTDE